MKALFFNSLDYKKRLPKLVRQPLRGFYEYNGSKKIYAWACAAA